MTDQIISRVIGNLGHITLNRPKALNALTLDMVREITRHMVCLLYTSPSPRDLSTSRMPSSA